MSGAKAYGLLVGAGMALLAGPSAPWWSHVGYWGMLAIHHALGATFLWRRTRLGLAGASFAITALVCTTIAGLGPMGLRFPVLSPFWWVFVGPAIAVAAGLFLLERRGRTAGWVSWRQRARDASLVDILLHRTFPVVPQRAGFPVGETGHPPR